MNTLTKLRSRPGLSNAYKYKNEKTLGPHGTYPVTKNGKPSVARAKAAVRLSGHAANPAMIKSKVARYAAKQKGNTAMSNFGKALLKRLTKKRNTYGGNKGDESASKRDFAGSKPTGRSGKSFGGKAGDRSKSRRDYSK